MSEDEAVRFIEKIEEVFSGDVEVVHEEIDKIIMLFLEELGYSNLSRVYRGLIKKLVN